MNCPKCDYKNENDEEVRIHSLYHHQFLIPQCSTELAKQSNIDYYLIRDRYHKLVKKLTLLEKRLDKILPGDYKHTLIYHRRRNEMKLYREKLNILPDGKKKIISKMMSNMFKLRMEKKRQMDFIKSEGIIL